MRNQFQIPVKLMLLLLAAGVAGLFGACQKPAESVSGKIQLVFWTMQLADFKDTIEPMLKAFEKTHPNVAVKWIDVPGNEIEKRTLTAVLSPNVPDVVNLNPDFSATLATRNALVDMAKSVPAETQKTYLPVAWQAATVVKSKHPMTFGLPWYITSKITLYNKAILNKAGYSQPPESYAELGSVSKQLFEKTHQYALMPILTQSGNFLKELTKINVPLYDANGKAVFATPKAIAQLQFYKDLYQKGLIPAEALTEDHRAAVDRYQSGSLAMLLVGPNFLKIVQENAPGIYKDTAVASQFPKESGFIDFSEMVLVVPSRTKHPKEAVELAAFITNHQNQLALAKAAPVLPSITQSLKDEYFLAGKSTDPMTIGRETSAKQLLDAKIAYQIRPRQGEINEVMNYYVQLALLGKLTSTDALKTAQMKINALF